MRTPDGGSDSGSPRARMSGLVHQPRRGTSLREQAALWRAAGGGHEVEGRAAEALRCWNQARFILGLPPRGWAGHMRSTDGGTAARSPDLGKR